MRFGLLYELQLPRPWEPDGAEKLLREALEQIELGMRRFGELSHRTRRQLGVLRLANGMCSAGSPKLRARLVILRRAASIGSFFDRRQPLFDSVGTRKLAQSSARCDPGKGLTDARVIGGHLRGPEQSLQFAGVTADRLHVIGGDLQQSAQILVE
jgi:hypothetical protein